MSSMLTIMFTVLKKVGQPTIVPSRCPGKVELINIRQVSFSVTRSTSKRPEANHLSTLWWKIAILNYFPHYLTTPRREITQQTPRILIIIIVNVI